LANLITSFACRTILFLAGFYWITYKKQKPRNYNTAYFDNLGEVPYATYISNHISWIDIVFYLAHPKSFGFISNHKVKDFCFVGAIATIIQCIFVDRSSKQSKQQCFVDLKERIENIKENPTGNILYQINCKDSTLL
jgi:1-acyl-sn-glycerol-3-phosphate acyltransferase